MKTKCLSRTQCLVAVSLLTLGVLLTCYSAIGTLRQNGIEDVEDITGAVPADEDGDAEYVEKRREFVNQFFGNGPEGVSFDAYAAALDAARALPASPLLQGGGFVSPEGLAVTPTWTSPIPPPIQNSYGGNASARVHALAIDPINANVVYTGSYGGLAKTTDGGVTWLYLSDAWASQSVSAITINPNASNVVYVGTGLSLPLGGDDYGPCGVGLYRSFDGGSTWSSPLGVAELAGTYVRNVAIDPNASSGQLMTTLYVANGGTNNCGLWRSTNSGTTWKRLRQGPPPSVSHGISDVAIDSSTYPSTLYVTEDDGTFKSTDSGRNWARIYAHLGNVGSRNRLSVVNCALYLLGPDDPDHNLYKSMDRGTTWIQISTKCPAGADSCANANGSISFSTFAVNSLNPQIILGGNQALYRTDNEGATWTEIGNKWGNGPDPAQRIHTDQRVIGFSRTAFGVVYEGNDGGIVRSTNGGLDWVNLNQNLPGALLYSVALSRDGSMIAGTQDHGVVFSEAGTQWDMIIGGDSNHDLIDPTGTTWAYSVGYTPNSFRRFNRGTHPYQRINISPTELINDHACSFFPAFSMNLSQPNHLLAACQRVVRTLDATSSPTPVWTTIGGALETNNNYVNAAYEAPNNSNVIYAVSRRSKVWVTTNANSGTAAIWSDVTRNLPGGIWAITVHPTDPQTAYLACDSGVYKTTNMGATWTQQIPQQLQNLVYRDVAIDPANPQHIFTASKAGVFASTDAGLSWGNMSNGIPAGMMIGALSFNAVSRQLAAATYGRGVYIVTLPTPPGL
jgi:photosystem II stability/assembly factor-like uncharacterized protein